MDPNYPSRLKDYLHFPESDEDSDSDFDPEEFESETDDEFEDSAEEEETDLTHLDPTNVITAGLYPHERERARVNEVKRSTVSGECFINSTNETAN